MHQLRRAADGRCPDPPRTGAPECRARARTAGARRRGHPPGAGSRPLRDCAVSGTLAALEDQMHIVFIELDTDAEWAVCSLGPAFLAAIARDKGHTAQMLRIPHDQPIAEIIARTREASPDLIGISMT